MNRRIFSLFIFSFLLAFIFVPCGADFLAAKPVMSTTVESAVAEAPVVCAAEVIGFQFDDLKTGETKMTSDRFFIGIRYRINEIFRGASEKIKKGSELTIATKSNTCLVFEEEVRREGNDLIFARKENSTGGGEKIIEERWSAPLGRKFILFLKEDLTHFGWLASPKPDDEAIRKLLKDGGLK